MEEFDAQDPVWKLLGKSRPTEASPFFAAKVLRAIETQPSSAPKWFPLWIFRNIAPVAACAVLALLAIVSVRPTAPISGLVAVDRAVDFETIADLDLLSANSDSSIWLYDSFAARP